MVLDMKPDDSVTQSTLSAVKTLLVSLKLRLRSDKTHSRTNEVNLRFNHLSGFTKRNESRHQG